MNLGFMNKVVTSLLFYYVLSVNLSAVFAQQQAVPAAPTSPASTDVAEIPSMPIAVPSKDGLVSLDFQDADIKNVLKVLAYKSNMNIVSGPEVTGTVTIQLNDVPWQKALDVVLSTYGYGYETSGNIITVTTMEKLKKRREEQQLLADQEPLVTKTYILNFAKAADVVDSITKMKTARGQINFDQRTNTLIIRDVQSNMDLIGQVIKSLDRSTPQVLIEAKIIETGFTNTENLGVDWNISLKASGAARPTTFPFHTKQNNRFITDIFPGPGASDTAVGQASGKDWVYGTLDASGFSAALDLLKSRSDTNILSDPKIVTLDNQTAKILVGESYPLPEYTYNQEQAKMQVSGWKYLDIGIVFEVTPHINNAGFVTLELNPKITERGLNVTVENTQVPILSTEEAKTRVMIKDGQTLVIAGLVKQKSTVDDKKVPFLGDMPIIGRAFKKKNDTKSKTELIIFLTPHIITNQVSDSTPTTAS